MLLLSMWFPVHSEKRIIIKGMNLIEKLHGKKLDF